MFHLVDYKDAPAEYCYNNCPRIYERREDREKFDEPPTDDSAVYSRLPVEFQSEEGRRIFPDRAKPCYLFIRHTRPQCRALRNFIVTNSTKLAVVKANYCGIATKVFNLRLGSLDPILSIGLVRFASTEQAFRFVIDERRMLLPEFLGGRYDVWNLTLSQPDRSLLPGPANPKKFISGENVFHFVHIQHLAHLPDGAELTGEAKMAALAASGEIQARLEASFDSIEQHGGRPIVKAATAARLRGQPYHNPKTEPRFAVYMTQWSGSGFFWRWYESAEGRKFNELLVELSGSGFESLLFTVCLDFVDLDL